MSKTPASPSLLSRLHLAMKQTAIIPTSIYRIVDNDAWCVYFGKLDGFYADIDLIDAGRACASYFAPGLASVAYNVGTDICDLRRWLIFAHAWVGDLHTTGQKLLMASRLSHNKACVQIQ